MNTEIESGFPTAILNEQETFGPDLPEDKERKTLYFRVHETSVGTFDAVEYFFEFSEVLEVACDDGAMTGEVYWSEPEDCWVVEVQPWWSSEGLFEVRENLFGRNATVEAAHAAYKVFLKVEGETKNGRG